LYVIFMMLGKRPGTTWVPESPCPKSMAKRLTVGAGCMEDRSVLSSIPRQYAMHLRFGDAKQL